MTHRDFDLSRRDLLLRGMGGAGVFAAGGLIAACGGSTGGGKSGTAHAGATPATSTGPTSGGTPVRGGTLRVGMLSQGSSETVNPQKALVQPDYVRCGNLYDQLFLTVPGGTAPGLATTGEPNKDGTVWTLKLRDGVTWHDGKPFTADDVVWTVKSWGTKASAYQTQASALIDFKGVKKLDKLTVQVPLIRPFASFPAFTSWVNAVVIQNGATDFRHPVGTGPYKYGSFAPGTQSTFYRNPDYWRGSPYVDELIVNSSFTDDAARINAVTSGQLDIAPGVPFALAKANAASGSVVLGDVPGPAFITIVMRVNVPPFNDPRVTQAFKLAVNRQAIVDNAYAGYATLGNDLVGYTWQDFANDIKPEYDPEKAKALLKAAGQENLSLPMYTAETLPGQNEVGTLVSADLKKIGVNAPLKQLPVDTYFTSASPGYLTDQRKLYTTYWFNFPPALGAFYDQALTPTGEFDETGWGHGPGQNALISAAKQELDPVKARQKWHDVQEQQVKQGGYLIPAWFNWLDAYAPNVRGVSTNSAGACANYDFHGAWLAHS